MKQVVKQEVMKQEVVKQELVVALKKKGVESSPENTHLLLTEEKNRSAQSFFLILWTLTKSEFEMH